MITTWLVCIMVRHVQFGLNHVSCIIKVAYIKICFNEI